MHLYLEIRHSFLVLPFLFFHKAERFSFGCHFYPASSGPLLCLARGRHLASKSSTHTFTQMMRTQHTLAHFLILSFSLADETLQFIESINSLL